MKFYNWFTTFIEEKEIDMSRPSGCTTIGIVCQKVCNTTDDEQKKIKDILVKIDFANGDVCHFLDHLAGSITEEEAREIELGMMDKMGL